MRRIAVFLLLLTLTSAPLYAQLQGQARVDSMLKELSKQKEDTNKVKLLSDLSAGYSDLNPEEGLKFGQQSVDLATKLDWKKGIAQAYSNLGNNYLKKPDYANALAYFLKSLKIVEEIHDKKDIGYVMCSIGDTYGAQNDCPKALDYYFKALKAYTEISYKRGIAGVNGNIGNVYYFLVDCPKALDYYFRSLKVFEEIGDKSGMAMVYGNIGNVYNIQDDNSKTLEYDFKALKLYQELGNKYGIARNNVNIGNVYSTLNEKSKGLEYYFSGLKILEEIGAKKGIAIVNGNIGDAYKDLKDYVLAADYFQRQVNIAEEIGDKHIIANGLCNIGGVYLAIIKDTTSKAGRATEVTGVTEMSVNRYVPVVPVPRDKRSLLAGAINHVSRSLAISRDIKATDALMRCYSNLAEAYKIKGDYKRAMAYGDSVKIIDDSVYSQENREKITRLENGRREFADSIKAATAQKVAEDKAEHRRNYEVIGGAAFLLLLGFVFLLRKKNKLLDNEKRQSDNLLLNILPEEVAAQLKDTGKSAAKQFDNITVMFTDFVNFTEASERMKPEALIEELDTCFKAFDEITSKYTVEKIKTIGDAYLAVCGLPTADPKHAENVLCAAVEINAFMQDRLAKMGSERTFAVRIGIHTGSVVAGIVGVKKFAYDIWGDTVNTAARMEQNSAAGKINISQTTYELVKDKFTCEYRGEVEAKGKGVMRMYFVN